MAEDVMEVEVAKNGKEHIEESNDLNNIHSEIKKETLKPNNLLGLRSKVPSNGILSTEDKASDTEKNKRLISALSFDTPDTSSSFKVFRSNEKNLSRNETKVHPPIMGNNLFNYYQKEPVRPVFNQKYSSKFKFEDTLNNTIAQILPEKSGPNKSAFRRKLNLPSPIANFDSFADDNALKRCNSAPMLNDIR